MVDRSRERISCDVSLTEVNHRPSIRDDLYAGAHSYANTKKRIATPRFHKLRMYKQAKL